QLTSLTQDSGIIAQAMPVKSVGVKADIRSYEHPALLTGQSDWESLLKVSTRVLAETADINRCVWNLSTQAPRQMRSLAAHMTHDRLELLREADQLVMDGLRRHGLYDVIWQCPTAMVPLEIDGLGRELVVIRPVHSERAMTARPAPLPVQLLEELRESISALDGVSGVAMDLTSKPPGTIEWE
ncbi:MAG: GMP synthase (glutamine-hydrolyzing), partial [Myxococcota bacterium]